MIAVPGFGGTFVRESVLEIFPIDAHDGLNFSLIQSMVTMQNFVQHVHVLDELVVEWQALTIIRFCIDAGLIFACYDLRRGMSMVISDHVHAQKLFGTVSFRRVDM